MKTAIRRAAFAAAAVLGFGLSCYGVAAFARGHCESARATQDLLTAVRDGGQVKGADGKVTLDHAARETLVADALRRGADPNARYGTDPAPIAAGYRYVARRFGYREWDTTLEAHDRLSVLLRAAEDEDAGLMRRLLAAGANPRAHGEGGETLLGNSARSLECAQIALDLGAGPNEKSGFCKTPEQVAQNGSLPLEDAYGVPTVTRLLLWRGADPRRLTHGLPVVDYLQQMEREFVHANPHFHPTPRFLQAQAARRKSLAMMRAAEDIAVARSM